MILVSEADIFFTESLRILAERLSQSEIGLPLRQIRYYSPPEAVGVFSTEINKMAAQIIIEYNGMWKLEDLLSIRYPRSFELQGVYSTVNGTTLDMYLMNMRNMLSMTEVTITLRNILPDI